MKLVPLLGAGQGYETRLVGKWHLGSWPGHGPNHHGFDQSYGALAGAVGAYDHLYRAHHHRHPNAVTWHRNHETIPGYENGKHVTDLLTDEAIKVISQKRNTPFFLYLPYFAPHTPLDERGRFITQPTQLDGDNPTRWVNEDRIEWFNDPKGIIQREADPEKRLFLAVVHHLDNAIGRVVAALEESGQREDTVIFFTSDNGPQVNWNGGSYPHDLRLTDFNQAIPFRGSKQDVYEGGVRVPGFVNWPGKVAPQELDTVQHVVDWLPTIAGLTGADANAPEGQPHLDGQDFSGRLLDAPEGDSGERSVYLTHQPQTNKWAVRRGNWKVVFYGRRTPDTLSWSLYNLIDDPAESNDLASSHPDVVRRLHRDFERLRASDKAGRNFPDFAHNER